MNNATISQAEKDRIAFLSNYEITPEGVEKYRKYIKKVTQEEADKLGKKLYDLISKKTCYDTTTEVEQVEIMLQGANLEYQTKNKGDTPLLLCSRRNYIKAFLLLIRAGADVNHANLYGTTPVMTSARHGNSEILKILIALKADINKQCLDGDTALMSAKRHSQLECFELLKQANAYFGIRNIYNQSVLQIPSEKVFDFNDFHGFEADLKISSSHESAISLINDAEKRLQEILGEDDSLLEQPESLSNIPVKRKVFVKVDK